MPTQRGEVGAQNLNNILQEAQPTDVNIKYGGIVYRLNDVMR